MLKTAKGKRPVYLDDPQVDKLLAIVMALTSEVSVLHDRLDTIECLLAAQGILSAADIDAYEPDEEVAKKREHWRTEYLARILRVLQEPLDTL